MFFGIKTSSAVTHTGKGLHKKSPPGMEDFYNILLLKSENYFFLAAFFAAFFLGAAFFAAFLGAAFFAAFLGAAFFAAFFFVAIFLKFNWLVNNT